MKNPSSSQKNFNRSEMMKQLWENGVFKRKRTEKYKDHMSKVVKEKRKDGKSLTPSELFNKTQDPRLKHVAKGKDHHRSKFWKLQSPSGSIIEGENLNELVRLNKELFLPEDIEVKENKASQCRAVTCLAQLKYLKPNGVLRRTNWKGWKLLLLKDLVTNEIEFEHPDNFKIKEIKNENQNQTVLQEEICEACY